MPQEAWVQLNRDGSWIQRPGASEIGALVHTFRNCTQQLSTTLDLLSQPVEQVGPQHAAQPPKEEPFHCNHKHGRFFNIKTA